MLIDLTGTAILARKISLVVAIELPNCNMIPKGYTARLKSSYLSIDTGLSRIWPNEKREIKVRSLPKQSLSLTADNLSVKQI